MRPEFSGCRTIDLFRGRKCMGLLLAEGMIFYAAVPRRGKKYKNMIKSHANVLNPMGPRRLAVGFTPAKYCGGNFYTRPSQIAGPALDPIWSPYGLPQAKKFGQYEKSSYLCRRY